MDNITLTDILIAVAVIAIIWALIAGFHKPKEKPFINASTTALAKGWSHRPLRPEDVPAAVTKRFGSLPVAEPRHVAKSDDSGTDSPRTD